MKHGSTSEVQVLDRAVRVLEAVEARPQTLAELVASTGLARATAHRLAVALEAHGLVARDPGGRFVLGPALSRLGAPATEGPALASLAVPLPEGPQHPTAAPVQLY